MSCTKTRVTFWESDHFFIIFMVKILFFSWKIVPYLKNQLWVLLKFWLSPGLMKKEKKYLALIWIWTWDSQVRVRCSYPYTTGASYKNMWFYKDINYIISSRDGWGPAYVHVCITELPKGSETSQRFSLDAWTMIYSNSS